MICTCCCCCVFRPSGRPTNDPTDRPSDRPTDRPTDNPTKNPTEPPSLNPSQAPTAIPTPRCDENGEYIILGKYWEVYLASTDTNVYLTGRYNRHSEVFINADDSNLQIWVEEFGNSYLLFVGPQDDYQLQLYYRYLVSEWTDDNNPIINSDDENNWYGGENQGSAIYTDYSYIYYGRSSGNQQEIGVAMMVIGAGFVTAIFAALQ